MGTVPAVRWTLEHATDMSKLTPAQKTCAQYGGFVLGVELFDSVAFGVSPSEVSAMDPQQRLLLDRSYTALHASVSKHIADARTLCQEAEAAQRYVESCRRRCREAKLPQPEDWLSAEVAPRDADLRACSVAGAHCSGTLHCC